jgi:taurine ABC transporter substrate-binding protein
MKSAARMGAVLAASLALLLGAAGASSARVRPAPPVVNIGYENNGADPEMVAIAENFFSTYMHAKVNLQYFASGPASLAALASGSLQFMTGIGNPPVVSAIAKGVPLQVIWAQERYTTDEGLVVRKGSAIKSLRDLKGQQVAIVLGSTSPFELDTELKDLGIPASSVTLDNMTPAAMVSAWQRHEINAAYVWDPAFDKMLAMGGQALMYDQTVFRQAPIFNLAVVNSTWAKSHASLVDGFIRAEQAGYAFYLSHPARALADMAKEAGISVALSKAELKGYYLYDVQRELSPLGLGTGSGVANSLVTRSLTSAAAYLYQNHTIQTIPKDMARFVNPTYCQAVAGGS